MPHILVDGVKVAITAQEAAAIAPVSVPQRVQPIVSRFQAKAALHQAGLLDAVESAISKADDLTRLAWADAQEFRRESPTIAALGAALSLSETQIDDLFRQAATIMA